MTGENDRVGKSKFLSLVLRHRPGLAGVTLDPAGWVDVDDLLAGCETAGRTISREELDEVVATNDKKRFEFNPDRRMIRASQGHSVGVDLGHSPVDPPEILFHGTVGRNIASIRARGLSRGKRHHVHLSPDRATAVKVGARRGKPVVLEIRAARMRADGMLFFLSPNGVWLTDHVPPEYLVFPEDRGEPQ